MKMKAKKLDKSTLEIIFYFIERLDGVLGKTHLQKMLFLTDLLSMKKFKEKLTAIDYRKYHYGPYSEAINDYTTELKKKGVIAEKKFSFRDGSERTYSRYHKTVNASIKGNLMKNIGAERVVLLDEVINSYGNMSLQGVLDIVYKLELVKGTEKNKPLDMAKETTIIDDEPSDDSLIF